MAKSDLLKEAIADARAVKETAVANAKIALQEAFAPRIQRMISDQIENELDSEEMPAEEPAMDDMGDMGAEEEGGDFNWVDNDLSAEVGGDTYDFEVGMAGEDGEEEMDMGAEEMPIDEPQSDEEMQDEYNEGDLNLEQIIRELEGDLTEEDEATHEAYEDLDEMEEPTTRKLPTDLEESDDASIDEIIESILREEDDMDMDMEEPEADEEVEEVKAELEEAYKTVRQLKTIINEVNLLNAKLLYTNKLFRNFELSEGQKMKVIENFDRAANTREVKLVFSTLAESFNRPTKKRVVKESSASKPVATTAPKTTNVITEGFAQAERWKKLAGLL